MSPLNLFEAYLPPTSLNYTSSRRAKLDVVAQLIALEKARDDKARTGWSYVLDVGDALKTPSRGLVAP
jgi:hypothetical protein